MHCGLRQRVQTLIFAPVPRYDGHRLCLAPSSATDPPSHSHVCVNLHLAQSALFELVRRIAYPDLLRIPFIKAGL
jgi:hypothetical protein